MYTLGIYILVKYFKKFLMKKMKMLLSFFFFFFTIFLISHKIFTKIDGSRHNRKREREHALVCVAQITGCVL